MKVRVSRMQRAGGFTYWPAGQGPEGIANSGDYEVNEAVGGVLIEMGAAEEVKPNKPAPSPPATTGRTPKANTSESTEEVK